MPLYPQEHPDILEKLIQHVDTTSIADILKRIVGADEQSSMLFVPSYAQWLSETPLIDLLLSRLGSQHSADVQANTADILSAIAHTQPTPLATKLMREDCVQALFSHALGASPAAPGADGAAAPAPKPQQAVLVPALDVAIALVEPRRMGQDLSGAGVSLSMSLAGGLDMSGMGGLGGMGGPGGANSAALAEATRRARGEAVAAIVRHLPSLVALMSSDDIAPRQETPFGLLTPALGRARLKVVELMAVLLRSGEASAEAALIDSGAIPACLALFQRYPFNNLLHHHVTGLLLSVIAMIDDYHGFSQVFGLAVDALQ